jgi:putative oxidoreductase
MALQRGAGKVTEGNIMTQQITTPGATARQVDWALLLIRIGSALAFIYHGSGILFGAFGGPGIAKFAAVMHNAPPIVAVLVGLAEFLGGIAVLTGVLTRPGAACIAIVMLGAIFMVHLPHGYDLQTGGFEYALTQLLIALALLAAGPGAFSLAALFSRHETTTGTPAGSPTVRG